MRRVGGMVMVVLMGGRGKGVIEDIAVAPSVAVVVGYCSRVAFTFPVCSLSVSVALSISVFLRSSAVGAWALQHCRAKVVHSDYRDPS